jgi:hypothetical protein
VISVNFGYHITRSKNTQRYLLADMFGRLCVRMGRIGIKFFQGVKSLVTKNELNSVVETKAVENKTEQRGLALL